MTWYPLQTLKNMITDRIHENHSRSIDGMDLQEFLHDIIDSLTGWDGELLAAGYHRTATITLDAGVRTVTFITPFPPGTVYTVAPLPGYTEDDDFIWRRPIPGSQTPAGYQINFDKPVTYTYVASIVT